MPCFLFTYHAHGSWMPDNRRGYVKRGKGILAPDRWMAERYRANLKQAVVCFDENVQQLLIEEALVACEHQQLRCHYIATETTHAHILVSWKSDRPWQVVRANLRESLTAGSIGKSIAEIGSPRVPAANKFAIGSTSTT